VDDGKRRHTLPLTSRFRRGADFDEGYIEAEASLGHLWRGQPAEGAGCGHAMTNATCQIGVMSHVSCLMAWATPSAGNGVCDTKTMAAGRYSGRAERFQSINYIYIYCLIDQSSGNINSSRLAEQDRAMLRKFSPTTALMAECL